MIYTLDGELHLQDVPTLLLHTLIRELTVPNPKYTNGWADPPTTSRRP